MPRLIQRYLVCFAVAMALLAGGCGSSGEWEPADRDLIRHLISEVPESRDSDEKQAELFEAGAIPDKSWWKTSSESLLVVDEISVSGDSATVTLELENMVGEVVGNATWQCKKLDDTWMITAAPLE